MGLCCHYAAIFCPIWYGSFVIPIGAFVRVTQDALGDEPLVKGMVGKVVADLYGRADLSVQTLVVFVGARKACAVPLEAVEEISESDYGDDLAMSRELWKHRRKLWRKRYGTVRHTPTRNIETRNSEERRSSSSSFPRFEVTDILRRTEAVTQTEIDAIASPAAIAILTEWSVGSLDVLARKLPAFKKMTYARARQVRIDHIERWLWDGLRLYLAIRSFNPLLPPICAESARDRVRALFDRIDEGDAAERLATFSMDVDGVKSALQRMTSYWLTKAATSFAKGLGDNEPLHQSLAQHVLQLLIVGYQVGFCADQSNHGIPTH